MEQAAVPPSSGGEGLLPDPLGDRTKEVRVALVLYGGVSLAVYINGTAREFFDLVRGRGVWGLVQELAGVDVTVDVVSGASAGGINGLFLAYALCGQREFQPLEDLWRDRGGFQRLVRRADETEARSLLDSAYMDRELQLAFRTMDRKPCDRRQELGSGEAPKELDCFLAVTNFDGHAETVGDFRGRPIEVKSHAARLHVKHRRGRWEPLSGPGDGEGRSEALSAKTLASFARATSAFPVAFEPVVLRGEDAGTFFDHRGPYLASGESAVFIDGGVLDNKPFTPLLPVIYQRHAARPVERLLFFVEPDPPQAEAKVGVDDDAGEADGPNFFQVAIASLSSLPGYESIADDLKALDRHNRRLDLLRSVFRTSTAEGIRQYEPLQPWEEEVYRRARLQGLMETLGGELSERALLDVEAEVLGEPVERGRPEQVARLFESFVVQLGSDERAWADFERDLDVEFYKRAYYYWIYRLHEELEERVGELDRRDGGEEDGGEEGVREEDLRRRIARLSSALRFLSNRVDMLLILETAGMKAVHEWSHRGRGDAGEGERRFTLSGLLATWRRHSHAGDDVARLVRGEEGTGADDVGFARRYAATPSDLNEPLLPVFLDTLREALKPVADLLTGAEGTRDVPVDPVDPIAPLGLADPVDHFRRVDARRFPAMLLGGVAEMDRIDYVRISARDSVGVQGSDPALGRWDDDPMSKVTGRQLGHFGAFLKRSWRSNDILWGRQDAATVLFDTLLLKNGGKLRLSRQRARRLLGNPERRKRVHPSLTSWLERFAESDQAGYREHCRELLRLHQQEIYRDGLCTVVADAVHEEIVRSNPRFDFSPRPPAGTSTGDDGRSHDERFQAAVVDTLRQFRGNCRDPLLRKITEATLPSRSASDLDRFFADHYGVGEERIKDLDPIDLTNVGLHVVRVLSNMTQHLLARGRVGTWLNRKVIGKATLGLTTLHLAVGSIRSGTFPILWFGTLFASLALLAAALFSDSLQISAWIPGGLAAILLMAPGFWFGRLHRVRMAGLFLVVLVAVVLGAWSREDWLPLVGTADDGIDALRGWLAGSSAGAGGGVWRALRVPAGLFAGGLAFGGLASWWWQRRRRRRRGLVPWWRRFRRRQAGETRPENELRARTAELMDLERRLAEHQRRTAALLTARQHAAKAADRLAIEVSGTRGRRVASGFRATLRRWMARLRPAGR